MSLETIVLSLGYSHGALPDRCYRRQQEHDGASQCEPGWLLCHGDSRSNLIRNELLQDPTSLYTQCFRVLAKALPLYVQHCGRNVMHSYLSTFSPWTLAALSIEASRQGTMTESVARVLGNHDFVDRLTIILSNKQCRHKIDLSSILHPTACIQRLELGYIHLEASVLRTLFKRYGSQLTHLSIHNCLVDNYGEALLLSSLPPTLQVLDISDNDWVTNECLCQLLDKNHYLHCVNVAGCHQVYACVLLRLNLEYRGRPLISIKRQTVASSG